MNNLCLLGHEFLHILSYVLRSAKIATTLFHAFKNEVSCIFFDLFASPSSFARANVTSIKNNLPIFPVGKIRLSRRKTFSKLHFLILPRYQRLRRSLFNVNRKKSPFFAP